MDDAVGVDRRRSEAEILEIIRAAAERVLGEPMENDLLDADSSFYFDSLSLSEIVVEVEAACGMKLDWTELRPTRLTLQRLAGYLTQIQPEDRPVADA